MFSLKPTERLTLEELWALSPKKKSINDRLDRIEDKIVSIDKVNQIDQQQFQNCIKAENNLMNCVEHIWSLIADLQKENNDLISRLETIEQLLQI